MDAKQLDYHDVLLRARDLECLAPQAWLNDQIVAFAFEYLARDKFQSHSDALLLIPGAMAMLIRSADAATLQPLLEPLRLESREVVLLALNDNPDVDVAGGGSHWSLLCFTKADSTFRHFDSCRGVNREVAMHTARQLRHLLGYCDEQAPPVVEEQRSPQQQNGYDCGVFLCIAAAAISQALLVHGCAPCELADRLHREITAGAALEWRRAKMQLIEQLQLRQSNHAKDS